MKMGPRTDSQSQKNFPAVRNADRGGPQSEVITFDELVAEINGSVAFAATKFPINPGMAVAFPKGSIKAALYSEWRCLKLEFYYKPEVSAFATQGQAGKIILAIDYDASNATPTTKQQVEVMHRVDDMPYEKMALQADSRSINRSDAKYVRSAALPVGQDVKTFDGGNLWVCTQGQAAATVIGELHARYSFLCTKVTLLNAVAGGADPSIALVRTTATEPSGATTVAAQLLFATSVSNGLGAVNTAGSIVPPAGNYLVDVQNTAHFTAPGGNTTPATVLDIQKNGVSVLTILPKSSVDLGAAGGSTDLSLTVPAFITMNGTDALTVQVTNTFAAGAATNAGILRLVAV